MVCQKISGMDACEDVVGGREKSVEPGPVLYFSYNEDLGVGNGAPRAKTETARESGSCQQITPENSGPP